jgi:hypothetical protein
VEEKPAGLILIGVRRHRVRRLLILL